MLREEVIPVDGIRTHVVHAGSGKPLLLLHGLGGPHMWQRVIEPCSTAFHVIAVDLPGFGASECPPSPYSTGRHAEFVVGVLDALSLPAATIAGISYGGQIAATI